MKPTLLNEGTPIQIQLPSTLNPSYQLPDPALLQIYEDRANRVLWLLDEVSEESGYDWVDFILRCNREDKDLPIEQRRPIKIIVSNYGGSLQIAKTLISIIDISKTPVYGYAIGPVCSAASMIYLACHKRFALPAAFFVIHKGSCAPNESDFNTLMAAMDDYRKQVEELIQFYIQRTKMTEEEIRKNIEKDWYLYASDKSIIDSGMVDAIINDIDDLL